MYTVLTFHNFPQNSKGFVNIHKAKNQMTHVVQDGIVLSKRPFDAIFSMLGILIAEIQVIL